MRVVTNTPLVKRNRQAATYLFLLTLALLIGGFFLVNQSLLTGEEPDALSLILQALVLPTSFIMTLVSVRMTNFWARTPRPEDALEEALSGLNKKSILYNYHHLPLRHLLISPQGVYAIVTRWHDGIHSVDNDLWRTQQGFFARFFSTLRMDGIGNPTREVLRQAQHAQKLLEAHAPGVKVEPLIVFISPNVELDIGTSSVPVVYADPREDQSLINYLRTINAEAGKKQTLPLSDEQISAFEAATL